MNNGNIQFIGVCILLFVIIALVNNMIREDRRKKVESITLGMAESEMLGIMGGRYNKSLLKNNRVKYEWRYSNGSSYGHSYKGLSSRTYSGVSKVDIYCKNGIVEEVKPLNL